MASVVGNTGAMATPARNTSIQATRGSRVCSIRYVVITIRMDAASVTVSADTEISTCEAPTRPSSMPERESERQNVQSARASGTPCAIKCCTSQFHTPTSDAT